MSALGVLAYAALGGGIILLVATSYKWTALALLTGYLLYAFVVAHRFYQSAWREDDDE